MKQVLFIHAGHRLTDGMFRCLCELQQQERLQVRALFFGPVDYPTVAAMYGRAVMSPSINMDMEESELVAEQKTEFAKQCAQHHISYEMPGNYGVWDKDFFAKETRFADLVLVSNELFFAGLDAHQPNAYLRQALRAAECPVLVVPSHFESIEHIFIAYDGTASSVSALKQFCYVFPHLLHLPAEIVYAKKEEDDNIPALQDLRRLAMTKFNNLGYDKLHFDAARLFPTWISEKKNALLITGAFGRSVLSNFAHHSFAAEILRDHRLPLFVAH
ncbi:MAG: hypothetical protein JST42_26750 [Bacteroidetes bacterium]|nr:hypothetical protein [Bacteroidota bacterium]